MGVGEYCCLRNPVVDLEAFNPEDHSVPPMEGLGSSSGDYGEKKPGIGGPERTRVLGLK